MVVAWGQGSASVLREREMTVRGKTECEKEKEDKREKECAFFIFCRSFQEVIRICKIRGEKKTKQETNMST